MSAPVPDFPDSLATRVSLLSRLQDAEDHASWQQFFDTYWRLLYNVARRAGLGDAEAQDVVQETVIAVSQRMPGFVYDRSRGSFKSWLLTIARRRIADHFRKKSYHFRGREIPREQALDASVTEGAANSLDGDFERMWNEEWARHTMQLALSKVKGEVTPLQFQMFQLHVLKELTVDEVKARLGVKATEVYWAKYRVGRKLERVLGEMEA